MVLHQSGLMKDIVQQFGWILLDYIQMKLEATGSSSIEASGAKFTHIYQCCAKVSAHAKKCCKPSNKKNIKTKEILNFSFKLYAVNSKKKTKQSLNLL